jgi:hypothetical protein
MENQDLFSQRKRLIGKGDFRQHDRTGLRKIFDGKSCLRQAGPAFGTYTLRQGTVFPGFSKESCRIVKCCFQTLFIYRHKLDPIVRHPCYQLNRQIDFSPPAPQHLYRNEEMRKIPLSFLILIV